MTTIVIDCGASFLKSAVIKDGRILKRMESASPKVHGDESIFEIIQIDELVNRIKETIRQLIGEEKEVALCISNEMHGFILANQDGSPYTDYISWQKEYGSICIEKKSSYEILLDKQFEKEILYSGMPLRSGLPSCNLLYMLRKGYLSNKIKRFYTLGDYIIRSLTGVEPICHPTNAAATGLFDLRTNNWNETLKEVVSKGNIIFPNIGFDTIKYEFEGTTMLIYPAIGDQQAALLGAGFNSVNEISYNLGTGSQVSKLVDVPKCGMNYQIRPYFNNLYLRTVPHIPSGRALNVYISFFKDILQNFDISIENEQIWNVILKLLDSDSKTNIQCDLSFFENTITDNVCGSINNIGEHEFTMDNLVHSIFDRMSDNYMVATKIVEPDYKMTKKVIFSGGVSRKIEYIRKKILENYAKDIDVVVAKDETLLGLYYYTEIGSKNE